MKNNSKTLCSKCNNPLDKNLECLICKKKKEKKNKIYGVIILVVILLIGGILMILYNKQMQDIQNPIKVYEAICEEDMDYCFKGDRIETTSIDGNYSDFLRTCSCQSCTEKNNQNPIKLNGFDDCKDLVKAENYMRCEEFVCSNKFIIKINE